MMRKQFGAITAQDIGHEFRRVRSATEKLVAGLTAEDLMVQSMPECSPGKWHLAHTTWFFETFILADQAGYRPFDPRFRDLFNSYYKQVGDHPFRGMRNMFSRPALDEVMAYRAHVDEAMTNLVAREVSDELQALIDLGLNHEQQHQELIVTDIKHAFYSQPLRPAFVRGGREEKSADVSVMRFCRFEGGVVPIGHTGAGFAFDNEIPRHDVLLQPFSLASRLVTNAEYLAFIDDDGYRRPELWLSDGCDTVQQQGWTAPLYWHHEGDSYKVFTSGGVKALVASEPVCHVSYYEADAYARWAGARLPLEAEWEHAAAREEVEGNFAESGTFHPVAATRSDDIQQLFGDAWEWTSSPYVSYPGFRPAPGAIGEYNGKFMCNQMVLRGGSCATPQSHIRATYRNFFPPHARWQFMGIRLARDER